MPRTVVNGQDVSTAIGGSGGGGGDISFGDGALGSVIISSNVDASGDQNYTSLTVQDGATLAAIAGEPLLVRSTGLVDVQGTGAIHADGRGSAGAAGGAGGGLSASDPGVLGVPGPTGFGLICASGGGGGGGGQGAFTTGGGPGGRGGNGEGQSLDRVIRAGFEAQDYTPIVITEGSSGSTSRTLHSFPLTGGALTEIGDYLDVTGWGNIDTSIVGTGGGVNFTLEFNFGGEQFSHVFTSTEISGGPTATTWVMHARIYFKTASTQDIVVSLFWHGAGVTNKDHLVRQLTIAGTEVMSSSIDVDWFGSIAQAGLDGNTFTQQGFKARTFLRSASTSTGGAGGAAGPIAEDGSTPSVILPLNTAMKTLFLSRRMAYRTNFPLGGGSGGGAGGGGAGGQFVPPAGGSAGTIGSQVGVGLGTGGNGGVGAGGVASAGGGGGASGAGGGYLEVWAGGDLSIGASSRISADGGAGGAGGAAGTASSWTGGGGAGAGGGAGGSVFVAFVGTPTNVNVAHIHAAGGSAGVGAAAVLNGGAGANGEPGETGCDLFVAV